MNIQVIKLIFSIYTWTHILLILPQDCVVMQQQNNPSDSNVVIWYGLFTVPWSKIIYLFQNIYNTNQQSWRAGKGA